MACDVVVKKYMELAYLIDDIALDREEKKSFMQLTSIKIEA